MKKNAFWWLCALAALVVLGLYSHHFTDILLTGDAAYNHSQVKEVYSQRHTDLLHIGYKYCGLTDHFVSGILTYFLPFGPSAIFGIFLFFLVGYICVRSEFPAQLRPWVLLAMILPFPAFFAQTYSAQGGHTYVVFQFLLGAWILVSPRFQGDSGSYRPLAYAAAGLTFGFALYAFRLSLLPGICLFVTLVLSDLLRLARRKPLKFTLLLPLKGTLAWLGFQLGYLPYTLSIQRFPNDHDFTSPGQLNISWAHAIETLPNLAETLARLFMPNFDHQLVLSGPLNHFNIPIHDMLSHWSWLGVVLVVVFVALFATLSAKRLWQTRANDRFILYLCLNFAAFLAGYLLRSDPISSDYGTRHLLAIYFVLILGTARLLPASLAVPLTAGMVLLSIVSHLEIIRVNRGFLAAGAKSTSCDSLPRSQVQELVRELRPPGIAGPYITVWPLALAYHHHLVWDVEKNKFFFHHPELARQPMAFFLYKGDDKPGSLRLLRSAFPRIPGTDRDRQFIGTHLGPYEALFEIMDPKTWETFLSERSLPAVLGWPELINQKLAAAGKGPCEFKDM